MGEILTHLSLLMPAFSLLYNPQPLSMALLLVQNAPLPIRTHFSIFSMLGDSFSLVYSKTSIVTMTNVMVGFRN